MRSRAARLTVLLLFMVALGSTAYLFRAGESRVAQEVASTRAFEDRLRSAAQAAFALRTAQQAYVAAGQNVEFWSNRVAASADMLGEALARLAAQAITPDAQSEMEMAGSTLESFAKLDKRARDYARTGQNLLASDLIFGDGLEMVDAITNSIEQARLAELPVRDAAVGTFRSRQLYALLAAAAASVLVVLLLVPRVEADAGTMLPAAPRAVQAADVPARAAEPADVELETAGWSPPARVAVVSPAAAPEPDAPAGEPETVEPAASGASPAEPATDFPGVAALCTDFARITDTRQLPALLERTAALLDASGIILWIADPEGRELNPILAQGYPPQLVNRLGVIQRDAKNATAAAFRTALMQIVGSDALSNGAIAAPLVTPAGCVGVMAAEVRHQGEKQHTRLAAAAIVAAQLATLVGPPIGRTHQAEATGA